MFVFEIPDSQKSLNQGDVAMLWEEHQFILQKKFYKSFPNFRL